MRPRGNAMLLGGSGPVFIGFSSTAAGSSVTVGFPAGTQPGDSAIMWATSGGSSAAITGGSGGWSGDSSQGADIGNAFNRKANLTSADISGTVITSCTEAIVVLVFRGVNAIGAPLANNPFAGSLSSGRTLTGGVTKPAGCLGLVFLMGDIGTPAGSLAVSSPSLPSLAYQPTAANFGAGLGSKRFAYDLRPFEYTNGTNIVFANFDSDGSSPTRVMVWPLT